MAFGAQFLQKHQHSYLVFLVVLRCSAPTNKRFKSEQKPLALFRASTIIANIFVRLSGRYVFVLT
ncbi:hypothetical protein AB4519_17710, partial [Vibrio splendidus]